MVSLSFKSLESYISEDNLSGLQAFLASRSVVIDDRDENGATALILAASKGKPEFCNELILHGADVNAEDNVSVHWHWFLSHSSARDNCCNHLSAHSI